MSKALIVKEKKGDKGVRTYITTGVGTARWPKLDKPDTKFKEGGEYRVEIVASGEEPWVNELRELCDKKLAEHIETLKVGMKKKKIKVCPDLPYKMVFARDENNEETEEETGEVAFRFKMEAEVRPRNGEVFQQRPSIFDSKNQPCSVRVGNGSQIRVSGELNLWHNEALGAGVSLRLKAVQLIKLVEGGKMDAAAFGFGVEEDGYDGSVGARSSEEAPASGPDSPAGGEDASGGDF